MGNVPNSCANRFCWTSIMMQQLTVHLLRMMDCLPLKEPVLIIRKGIMCGRFKLSWIRACFIALCIKIPYFISIAVLKSCITKVLIKVLGLRTSYWNISACLQIIINKSSAPSLSVLIEKRTWTIMCSNFMRPLRILLRASSIHFP